MKTGIAAHSNAQVDSEISAMADSVQQALALSGEGSEAYADSEIQNMIQSHLKNMVAENIMSEQTQKTNLETTALADAQLEVSTKPKFLAANMLR